MAKINPNMFDESKIIKKDNGSLLTPLEQKIEEVKIENTIEKSIKNKPEKIEVNVEKNATKSPKTSGKNLTDKSKEYLNIVENEERKNQKPIKDNVVKPIIDNSEQLLMVQEAQLMLESVKKNIIKTKIEIKIYKELHQSEFQKSDKELYESKLKLLGKDLIYFEKRKNIIETIINTELSKRAN